MMYEGGHGFGGGFMWLIWIVLIFIVIWGVKSMGNNSSAQLGNDSNALNILKERYAKGEITKEEFDEMKNNI